MTSRSGLAYGSGFRSTASTTVKIAVFAPMPSVSVRSAAAVKPGRPAEHAEAVPDVLPQRFQERQAALIAPRVCDLRLAAEREPRRAPRRGRVETLARDGAPPASRDGTRAPRASSRSRRPRPRDTHQAGEEFAKVICLSRGFTRGHYSALSAHAGSIRSARRIGTQWANSATKVSTAAAPANVSGSTGLTPNTSAPRIPGGHQRRREARRDADRDQLEATARETSRSTSRRCAPSATRTPTSRVRCATP